MLYSLCRSERKKRGKENSFASFYLNLISALESHLEIIKDIFKIVGLEENIILF